jgi:hypothetical protein
MHFEIRRGFTGGRLTKMQRTSGLFAEEPTVLGRVLRKGSKPLVVSEEQFQRNKVKLLLLAVAGSIQISEVEDGQKQIASKVQLGDDVGPSPASSTTATEELEATEPPSSEAVESSKEM